jgi:hypothetical protein
MPIEKITDYPGPRPIFTVIFTDTQHKALVPVVARFAYRIKEIQFAVAVVQQVATGGIAVGGCKKQAFFVPSIRPNFIVVTSAARNPGLTTSLLRMDMPGKNMGLYPNPASNTIYFKGIDEPVLLSILSSEGRLIKQPKVEKSLDISDLRSGFYILKSMGYRPSVLIKTE